MRARWVRRFVGGATAIALATGVVATFTIGPAAAAVGVEPDPWMSRRVLDVAHAGGDLEAPHSTLFAMKRAVGGGADVLEMDVRLSLDGVLVVQHDDTVDRTTDGTGAVRDLTVAQLQALDNGYWFVPDCWSCHDRPEDEYLYRGIRTGDRPAPPGYAPDDFTIPTFAEVAATFPARLLDVEIKDGPDGFAAAEALAAFIAEQPRPDRFLVASFSDEILAHFKALAPDVATSPGLNETIGWFGTREAMPHHKVLQVPPVYSGIEVITQQFVDDAHADGLAVWVWFNGNDDDQAVEWQRLLDLGVDALLTGKPRAAQAVLESNRAAFRVAPEVGAAWARHDGRVTGRVACPPVHVARCRSIAVLVGFDRSGNTRIGAMGIVAARRGEANSVTLRLRPGTRLAPRPGPDALLLLFAGNDDTEAIVVPVRLG